MLTVLVNSADTRDGFTGATIENATFCKTRGPNDGKPGAGDPKRPGPVSTIDTSIIQVCPDDLTQDVPEVTTAVPEAWYVRIVFDELLDPAIEDLVPVIDSDGNPTGTFTGTFVNTQPVTLQCASVNGGMVDVPYDGYYSPSGNSITYPLGPSIVIKPNNPSLIATTSACQISLHDNILDKTEIPVPPDQRGPYTFAIDSIRVAAISPSDMSMVDPAAAGVDLTFNTKVDFSSLAFAPDPNPTFNFSPNVDNVGPFPEASDELFLFGDFPASGGPFTFTFNTGATISDRCGVTTTFAAASTDTLTQTSFSTNPIMLNGISGASEPGKKVRLSFNQYMDATTLLAAGFSITPTLANMEIEDDGSDQTTLLVYGDYQLGTAYTFTLNANATIKDCPGEEDFEGFEASVDFGTPGVPGTCTSSATFTNTTAQPVQFTTSSAIALKSISPADNSVVVKGDVADPVSITLTFNQEIDPASFDASDYTITPNVTLVTDTVPALSGRAGHTDPVTFGNDYENLVLEPDLNATLAPGNYTFTLKQGAVLKDMLGNSFTNPSAQVIHFTVQNPPPPSPPCL